MGPLLKRGGPAMFLQVTALFVLGLMCGSELNVAAFARPTFERMPREPHILARALLAQLLGRVMPFWMAGSTLLSLILLLPFAHLNSSARSYATIALAIQILAVVFSLIGPVPINNRIAKWTPPTLPDDWQTQERRWNVYHWIRTFGLCVAFVLLAVSLRAT